MAENLCWQCGHQSTSRFCTNCGADSRCPICSLTVTTPFCTACGTALTNSVARTVATGELSTEISFSDIGLKRNGDDLGYGDASAVTEIAQTKVDGSGFRPDRTANQQSRGKKKVASVVMAALLVAVASLVAFQFFARRDQNLGTTMRASDPTDLSVTTLPPTTLTSTTTTVPRTTTTFNGRSYCNADGIAKLLAEGGFEGVPAGSWSTAGLYTYDRRIKYTADRMWALAYTHYLAGGTQSHPWPEDATPVGWLNCQSGQWVYIANGLTFAPTCAAMEPEFQAAYLELTGTSCQ